MLVKVGEVKSFALKVVDANNYPVFDDTVVATIKDKSNDKFFNGLFWVDKQCELIVPHKGDGIYSFDFIPEQVSFFEVDLKSKSHRIASKEIIESIENIDEDIDSGMSYNPIVKITNKVFKNQDGTDTTILDSNKNPLPGVKITCYDMKTKDVVAVTQSNSKGEWEMYVKHGSYFFTFEKDGYISVSFERTVDICP